MAELRRKPRARQVSTIRRAPRPATRPLLRIVRGTVTRPSAASTARPVKKIIQFKSRATGRYLIAIYTQNPQTKREERVVVDPKTLSPEKMKQLKAWHQHHQSKGSWMHAIATDPHTWVAIGKILLAA